MKIAAVQMTSGLSVERNLSFALETIEQSSALGCELVALPEYFCLLGQRDTDKLNIAESLGSGRIQNTLREAASRYRIWVIAGTLPIQGSKPDRVFNTCLAIDPSGEIVARYDKIHLFAFDNGTERYDEARVLEAGRQGCHFSLTSADGHDWRIALSVCYDLRFPELYRSLRPDLILVPSAFTHTTGRAHWEVLLRARAIENVSYVVAPAQAGFHENGRRTWGQSMIVNTWGEILAQLPSNQTGVIHADLDPQAMKDNRIQLPALTHRRL